ncbi:MAG: FCSD flavin-binding domain-containing protein [Nevskia sp.]|jgi:sulfide dehydrogenase [flavocytochrome c] flavoprotein subunit|uniref:FCSD flavin-binding domain-containing protein n=1 Tax=Nevskia sp. TaxID=1929292 RepID=UPI0040362CAB
MNRSRRRWLQSAALAGLGAAVPTLALARPKARVIVIGAGYGGATCAKTLRALSPQVDVLLIDARARWCTGPFTNLAVTGLTSIEHITRSTADIGRAHGVGTRVETVTAIDPVAMTVTLAGGERLKADRIVVSPGIAMRWGVIEGLTAELSGAMPHAWTGDAQVLALRDRIDALPDGATVLIAAPPNPYRCPPGPYERASLIAERLLTTGRKRCKILIADAKDDFTKRPLFLAEWDERYGGMIEWISRSKGGEVVRVDPATGEVWLRDQAASIGTHLASVVPPQQAAAIAGVADLADESGWCPVHPQTFESTRHAGIHVIGDATIASPMPKSAFAANSQAKLCAAAIAAALDGRAAPDARMINTCYSLVAHDAAISVSGFYSAASGRIAIVSEGLSPLSPPDGLRQREAAQAHDWYESISTDSFGRARR